MAFTERGIQRQQRTLFAGDPFSPHPPKSQAEHGGFSLFVGDKHITIDSG
jgi:hypothetical protein